MLRDPVGQTYLEQICSVWALSSIHSSLTGKVLWNPREHHRLIESLTLPLRTVHQLPQQLNSFRWSLLKLPGQMAA